MEDAAIREDAGANGDLSRTSSTTTALDEAIERLGFSVNTIKMLGLKNIQITDDFIPVLEIILEAAKETQHLRAKLESLETEYQSAISHAVDNGQAAKKWCEEAQQLRAENERLRMPLDCQGVTDGKGKIG